MALITQLYCFILNNYCFGYQYYIAVTFHFSFSAYIQMHYKCKCIINSHIINFMIVCIPDEVSQFCPVNSGAQSHVKFPFASMHVPLFWQKSIIINTQ